MASIDLAAYRAREAQGLITCRPHPTDDLLIWNYTPKCVYGHAWDEVTRQARGLITRSDGAIVSRCMKKFFNHGEAVEEQLSQPLDGPITVTEKMDGSLGILFHDASGQPAIATRGSFTSEQAQRATVLLRERYGDFPFQRQYTYLFEILLPENRIVVDYGACEDLVLLTVIETESGKELAIHAPVWAERWPFPVVRRYEGLRGFAELVARYEQENQEEGEAGSNREGFVVRFEETGQRLKFKFSDYVRLHKLLTQCTARAIWAFLRENKSLTEFYDRVPPEFAAWVKETSKALSKQALFLQKETERVYKLVVATTSIPVPFPVGETLSAGNLKHLEGLMKRTVRDAFARYPELEYFLFMTYDGAKYHHPDGRSSSGKEAVRLAIWDSLYPPASKPFRIAEELENGREAGPERKEEGVTV